MSAAALSPALLARQSTDTLIAARELVENILDFRARQHSLFEPKPEPKPVLVPKPAPTANEGVPAILSPSSVSGWADCQARWYYRKVLQLPEERTGALALGSAVHEAVAANFEQKVTTFVDLPVAAVQAVFRDSLARQLETMTVSADEAAELRDCGDMLTRVYMTNAAPAIQPAAVELPVEGVIGGVPVHGFIDVLTDEGMVVDLKTSSKKPTGVSASHRLQVATYAMLAPGANGWARRDVVTKTKTVGHFEQTFQVTPADRTYTERLYSITLDQMQTGLIAPNRGSFCCSRHNCSYWAACESDYGGVVGE